MSTTKTDDRVAWGRVWQVGCYSVLLCLGLGLVSKVWGAPLLTKEARLTDPNAAGGFEHFGSSVALSANGKVVLIGAPYEDCPHVIECGAAYVFVRKEGSWVKQQKLTTPSAAVMGHFGSVALSANGEVALVGARGEGDYLECLFCGAAYIFVREGDAWVERQRLTASDAKALDRFGGGKLSANGEVAFIGGGGATYVFVREGDAWVERQKLIPPLAISANGEVALAGAPGEDCTAEDPDCGAAYIVVREGDAWVIRQRLTASDAAAFDHFGAPSALSASGEVVLIGASDDDCIVGEEVFNCGAAYIFVREGDAWVERQKLTGRRKHPLTSFFGRSIALSASGEMALVGANGKAFVFVREGSTWVRRQRLSAVSAGVVPPVALSANGKRALIGRPNYNCTGGPICGAVNVFRK